MTYTVHEADVLEALRAMPDNSFHGCLTDPPYGLTKDGGKTGFMGHTWDRGVPPVEVWREVLRVLKPGAHLLAFGGTRTYHRLTCAIEDAGFEIRDCMMWLYGCLSEDTEVLIDGRWEHYSKAMAGRLALCYNVEHGTYSWQPIAERVEYDYDDTAYRITSERTDQIVSRNHRCIVDRGAGWEFSLAEEAARESAVVVPVLQDVQGLLCQLRDTQPSASASEHDVLEGLRGSGSRAEGARASIADEPQGDSAMRDLRQGCAPLAVEGGAGSASVLLRRMQRRTEGEDADAARPQGPRGVDGRVSALVHGEDDGAAQPGVEGRRDVLQFARELHRREVRAVPGPVPVDGKGGRIRNGAPTRCGSSDGPPSSALRGGAPHGPQPEEQRAGEPGSLRHELGPQEVRGEGLTASDLAVIEPIHYVGKVWCLRVPTGAFVARRNGKVFVTGNSGFPKSHDVSKALDREAGAEREVVGPKVYGDGQVYNGGPASGRSGGGIMGVPAARGQSLATSAATEVARQFAGHGTALKPAWEPIIVARKPLTGTVAANCQEHGCGALAIDASRVSTDWGDRSESWKRSGHSAKPDAEKIAAPAGTGIQCHELGRWPANVIFDEVAATVLDEQSGIRGGASPASGATLTGASTSSARGSMRGVAATPFHGKVDGASRFFYTAKASKAERNAGLSEPCIHPTVKPLALTKYLARLILPPIDGSRLLTPFCGSGSEMIGALQAGWSEVVGIDSWDVAVKIARARLAHHEALLAKQEEQLSLVGT